MGVLTFNKPYHPFDSTILRAYNEKRFQKKIIFNKNLWLIIGLSEDMQKRIVLMKADIMQDWLAHLTENGSRLTGPRYIITEILAISDRALSPQEIHSAARQRYPSLGLVSVYRTLEILEDLHLIQRVHQPDKCQAYIAACHGHQHLLVCSQCGRVTFFDGDNIDNLVQRVEHESGFQIHDHWLQFFGLCSDCSASQRESAQKSGVTQ
ncbi:MAG: transcriptional repressor [Anaerolineales bacterium]|nr:transcriptional repressor [Anaerolineales bacterium]